MKRYGVLLEKLTHWQIVFKCVKTHDSRLRDLVGNTIRERQRVSNADTKYVDPSVLGVHNENSDDIWSICTCSLTHAICYAMHGRRYILLADICSEYANSTVADFIIKYLFGKFLCVCTGLNLERHGPLKELLGTQYIERVFSVTIYAFWRGASSTTRDTWATICSPE